MGRVAFFETGADNVERAVKFYKSVFGWEITKWEGTEDYWLVKTGPDNEPGIDGAITKRMGTLTTVNTANVSSLDEAIAKVEASGGKVVRPRTTVPGVGYLAYCQDSEGNVFGLMEAMQNPTM